MDRCLSVNGTTRKAVYHESIHVFYGFLKSDRTDRFDQKLARWTGPLTLKYQTFLEPMP